MKPIVIELPASGPMCYRAVIKPGDPVTVCEIQKQHLPIHDSHWQLAWFGISICRNGDRYLLETGCRLALKSALRKPADYEEAGSKGFRASAWAAYLERFPVSERTAADETVIRQQIVSACVRAIRNRLRRDMVFCLNNAINTVRS